MQCCIYTHCGLNILLHFNNWCFVFEYFLIIFFKMYMMDNEQKINKWELEDREPSRTGVPEACWEMALLQQAKNILFRGSDINVSQYWTRGFLVLVLPCQPAGSLSPPPSSLPRRPLQVRKRRANAIQGVEEEDVKGVKNWRPPPPSLTSLLGLFWSRAGDAAALQTEGWVHLAGAASRLLHLLHVGLHQLGRHLLTHPRELLCVRRQQLVWVTITLKGPVYWKLGLNHDGK